MSTMSLCLGFLQLAGTSISPPPRNIQKLIHDRVSHQWQQTNPSAPELNFDDPSCPIIGYYSYTERSVTMSADSKEWRGPLEISLTSLIEGEKIPFETVLPTQCHVRFNSRGDLSQYEMEKMDTLDAGGRGNRQYCICDGSTRKPHPPARGTET